MEPGGIEAIGDAVTGGLAARALEPEAGEGKTHEKACLNCGAGLLGPHCHVCGQKGHVHRTLTAWWHDFLHGVLHLDGKLWHTLPLLAWRPGDLTRRYIEGERARFVSPLALFLFSVFLMFATFSATGGGLDKLNTGISPDVRRELAAEQKQEEARLARLEAERSRLAARRQDLGAIDARIAEARRDVAVRTVARRTTENGLNVQVTEQPSNVDWFNKAYKKAKQNPSLLLYKLQSNAYKFSWALIPISVPFVWLLFLHRRRYRREYKGYDHLVFVTYSIAFMSLFMIAIVLLTLIGLGGAWLGLLIACVPPIHIYRQLRGAYALSRFSALWRTLALLLFALVSAILFMLGLLALGVLA
jgi:hypothetical protein